MNKDIFESIPSFAEQVVMNDLLGEWEPLIKEKRYAYNPDDGKIYRMGDFENTPQINIDPPWIYVNNNPEAHCDIWHDVHNTLGFIHSNCHQCWKVAVRLQNLGQLMKMWPTMMKMAEEDPTCHGKCGIEVRPWVFGNYGAYFYNPSKEAGLDKLDWVRQVVTENIHPDVECFLKRGCTEFERAHGPSDKWEIGPLNQQWEPQIAEKIVMKAFPYTQSEDVIRKIIRRWIKFAWDNGDPTVFHFTDGKPVGKPVVRYERPEGE